MIAVMQYRKGRQSPGRHLLLGLIPVRGDYFGAMRIRVLRGRAFGPDNHADAPPVAVINETMAERHWADSDPVGKRFLRGDTPIRIVGVVPDVKQDSLAADPVPEAYLPHDQATWAGEMYVVLRGGGDLVTLIRTSVEDEAAAWQLFCSRPDKSYSLTDCLSFVMMRRLEIRTAIALDDDFQREGFQVWP